MALAAASGCAMDGERSPSVGAAAQGLTVDVAVNTTDDVIGSDGACSLREALRWSWGAPVADCAAAPLASGNTARVIVPAGTYALQIQPARDAQGKYVDDATPGIAGDLDLPPRGVEIVGAGVDSTVLDGAGIDRVLHAQSGIAGCAHSLRGLTVRGGCAHGGACQANATTGYPAAGGGFYDNSTCSLTVVDVVMRENSAATGGGLALCATGKAAVEFGWLTLEANTARTGGGIEAHVDWTGTGIQIVANTASETGGAVSQYDRTATLVAPWIAGNSAAFGGGGVHARGKNAFTSGAIAVTGGALYANSSGTSGGGVLAGERGSWDRCAAGVPCRVVLDGVIVRANTADMPTSAPSGSGGGIAATAGGLIELHGASSVIQNSDPSAPSAPDCASVAASSVVLYDHALVGDVAGCAYTDARAPI